MDHHVDRAQHAQVATMGKLVLSRLPPGQGMIPANAPTLKLILDGECRYNFDGRTLVVRAGECLYLDAGTSCLVDNRAATIGLCIGVPQLARAPGGETGDPHDPVLGRSLVLSTRASAMGRTLEEYGRRIVGDPALGEALAGELCATVEYAIAEPLAESRAAIDGLKAAKPSTRRELYRRLERARGFLHDHDDRNVTLGEMASDAGLSQFHLARYFKAAFGQAPISYHRDLRLARAADLLREGHSVASAAEATGYSDQVALSHAFRRRYGAPPQSWTQQRLAS
jgi:AraC-like DNA-binding protein/quercetin dioxygenase-like cupin family protein